ncbi:L,D-transpeptidase family protein [Rhizobiaceae bacterium n13]|uniref:L,D-transpeptidase family protein n=1 Tax=Ferirhizobium litorale TaxID=2927786 RepID=A0AAE3QJ08_9HYPH|nr:L,D-transpeptidase family protein [Fererhizobium litorale]MDI7863862.1 L,D-transpeptidase family protein [Fererhizobium litorale]MDI7924306.1 L,D-transpeptidase family protein [Fererhizobium litorale]
MKYLTKAAALTLALTSSAVMFQTERAEAGFLDFLRGNRAGQRVYEPYATSPRAYPRAPAPMAGGSMANVDPEPLPKVSGPRYYTYKPDSMRLVAAAKFADPVVTGAVADSGSVPVAVDPLAEQRHLMSEAKVRTSSEIAKVLETYYGEGQPLVWVTGSEVNERARAAMKALSETDAVGLDPRDYAVSLPVEGDQATRDRSLMQFELALSAKVLAYVQDTNRGRIDPNKISGYHDFKRKTVNLAPVLKMVRLSPNVEAYLKSRSPSGEQFRALTAELARLRAMDGADDHVKVTLTGLLKPGASDPEMANVVKAIEKRGSDDLKVKHAVVLASYQQTPEYTPELVDLVKDFQTENRLKPDGVIGQATVRALVGDSNAAKIEKLVVALEQARWLPADLGSRYVFINQPAFQVYYHDDNGEQFSMRVVVGTRANQTYFFQDEIETVEFNPFWGVPQSIIINEMLPKLRADPGYLDQMGYEVVVGGRQVSSSSVNWYGSTKSVSVRQPPSSDNALGELKILFPNSHAIYMHDTPSKSFFNKDMRALSHGCVRLADPRRMAAAVLGTSTDEVAREIAAGGNRAVQLSRKIPVYVSYFTAWPNKDGVVEYFGDVYGRDAYVEKAFAATSESRNTPI